jgi:hypothetical protein
MLKRTKAQTSTPTLDHLGPFYRILAFAVAPAQSRTSSAAQAPAIRDTGKNEPVDLARVAWLLTVLACLVAVVILALDGYLGYAGVTLAVALSAAINLT